MDFAMSTLEAKHINRGLWLFGMWFCITGKVVPDLLKGCCAVIFKGTGVLKEHTMLLNLETSETTGPVTCHHIPEEWNPQHHQCENPTTCIHNTLVLRPTM